MRRRPVEHCHSAAVLPWSVRCDEAIPRLPTGVDSVSEFFLLEDSEVHVGL